MSGFGPQNTSFPGWLVEQVSQNVQQGNQDPEFWALRPEWMDEDERAAFAAEHPDLVEKYADCWAEVS